MSEDEFKEETSEEEEEEEEKEDDIEEKLAKAFEEQEESSEPEEPGGILKRRRGRRKEEKKEAEKKKIEMGGIADAATKEAMETVFRQFPRYLSDEIKKIARDSTYDYLKSIYLFSKMKYYSMLDGPTIIACMDLFDEISKRHYLMMEKAIQFGTASSVKSMYQTYNEAVKGLIENRQLLSMISFQLHEPDSCNEGFP